MKARNTILACGLIILLPSCKKDPPVSINPAASVSLTKVEDKSKLEKFWSYFRASVKEGDDDKIASYISVPLIGMEDTYKSKDELIADYERIFPEEARRAIINSDVRDLELHQHKNGGYWEYRWWNGVDSEGQHTVDYHIGIVAGEFKVIRVLAAG